jgi:hypothetical protein
MSNTVKRKKLTKRIALRLPHATWRAIAKQARLLALTPSELVREAIHHYQGHLRPLTEFTKSAAAGPDQKAIERDMAAIAERTASTFTPSDEALELPEVSWARQAIDSLWERELAERSASTPPKSYAGIVSWGSGATHPKAQPPGPPGGAGFASVPGPHGETEVSVASPKRNRR